MNPTDPTAGTFVIGNGLGVLFNALLKFTPLLAPAFEKLSTIQKVGSVVGLLVLGSVGYMFLGPGPEDWFNALVALLGLLSGTATGHQFTRKIGK